MADRTCKGCGERTPEHVVRIHGMIHNRADCSGVADTMERPDLEELTTEIYTPNVNAIARYALHLEAEVRRLSDRERCQHCGEDGLPSPTVVLDLRAEVESLEAETRRLQEQLDEYEKLPTDEEINAALEAAGLNPHDEATHNANTLIFNRLHLHAERNSEDAELFRTLEEGFEVKPVILERDTPDEFNATKFFGETFLLNGIYESPRDFLRALREQSITRTEGAE